MATKFWQTVGLGVLAGMRSMTAPALLSHSLANNPSKKLGKSRLRFLQSPTTATVLKVMAGGEMVGDKLPNAPDRTVPPVLGGRIVSGALVGAATYRAAGGKALQGALLGSAAAVAATYGALALRKYLGKATGLPDTVWGLTEDATTVASGLALLKNPNYSKKNAREAKRKDVKVPKAKRPRLPHA
ncbi:DUF4126 domain-containing protein [Hymenobacter crusticola]|uniref:DUF4126 domain-containing protein n=1 Tax=Hymenobacter crusticola TaxID=1770526 RepID=A0A243W9J5_9BACT|nr:DUF4126 domain-containing protein [Hymenobacter crusticola]OUJ71912.1 hypothetical protein BXP70_20005 [Hymenobacter crusticola]